VTKKGKELIKDLARMETVADPVQNWPYVTVARRLIVSLPRQGAWAI
jgi:hypothetical protein